MRISLLHVEDCPSVAAAATRLAEALRRTGHPDVPVELVLVESDVQARLLPWSGSPTILVDGVDPFAPEDATPVGLTCRVYRTADGHSGAPSLDDLVEALSSRG